LSPGLAGSSPLQTPFILTWLRSLKRQSHEIFDLCFFHK
jgi:hypothetical protein